MAALRPALAAALGELGGILRGARDPWWLIGSAAMALHGVTVEPEDVDLLTSVADAERLFAGRVVPGVPSQLFRSRLFGRWTLGSAAIEVMAELEVRSSGRWQHVQPSNREACLFEGTTLYTPGLSGLLDLCRQFDRPKDRARAALLRRRIDEEGCG